jgi:futalosine hydrolase
LGIEEENEFLTLFDSGYMKPDEFPFENSLLRADKLPYGLSLQGVKAITTNISHGRRASISRLKNQFSAQVESMEGAAVFYVCRWFGLPCLQVRAVSNYVAPRDEAQWDIPLALENLKNTLIQLLRELGRQVD